MKNATIYVSVFSFCCHLDNDFDEFLLMTMQMTVLMTNDFGEFVIKVDNLYDSGLKILYF